MEQRKAGINEPQKKLKVISDIRKKIYNIIRGSKDFKNRLIDVFLDKNFIFNVSAQPRLIFLLKEKKDLDHIMSYFSDTEIDFLDTSDILSGNGKDLFFNAYSLMHSKFLSQMIGFESVRLFFYSLSGMSQLKKTQFVYTLYGREKKKGVINVVKGSRLTNGAISIPELGAEQIIALFDKFGVQYKEMKVLAEKKVLE
ncbi:MAG: hypothetical protein B6U68_00520 [Candidatus Aenigmarchaeota archaeon ex4484_14]|nr:MAG: hypothetical protein B6U68_00520 [Candidatus Aenigmarchaeota archaeon ex4484_14]